MVSPKSCGFDAANALCDYLAKVVMYRNAVKYKDTWLAPGSYAKQLYDEKKYAALDKHLKELDDAFRKLSGLK